MKSGAEGLRIISVLNDMICRRLSMGSHMGQPVVVRELVQEVLLVLVLDFEAVREVQIQELEVQEVLEMVGMGLNPA